ncbi:MAG TPA: uracil-DNA glycosylase [Bacillales bacterium]|nr:uracil-DNA glycosylase [Bacillales bacterium]
MTPFCPIVWPEDPVPAEVQNCKICGLDTHGTRMVWGEGCPTAPIFVVLDNPGMRESREGEPFVCGTRKTLQEAAFHAGFGTEDLYVTYVLKRRPIRKYDKPATRRLCMRHLREQLLSRRPEMLFCLGDAAVQSVFDDPTLNVKSLRSTVHEIFSLPAVVSYHPLAVRRRPNLRTLFMKDWSYLYKLYK